jgi:undecaprenyl diphosphate synthase
MTKINKRIDMARLPKHIAFIMDGNGRWARARGLVRTLGHRVGYERVMTAVERCAGLGIKVCSIYAFSTENWARPKDEIDEIFRIVREGMQRDSDRFMQLGVRVTAMGDITRFPKDLQDKLVETMERTKNNTRCTLNLCINYGGRADILHAVNRVLADGKIKKLESESDFGAYLYGAGLPDPDLIVRTSGEQRVSNFMLWQMAYSEFLFLKTLWPDINEKLIDKCIIEFQKRKRRYGKV